MDREDRKNTTEKTGETAYTVITVFSVFNVFFLFGGGMPFALTFLVFLLAHLAECRRACGGGPGGRLGNQGRGRSRLRVHLRALGRENLMFLGRFPS